MDALTGKLLADRYQLFERLDDTASALTYRGQDRQLGAACRVVVPKLSARASFGSFERTWRQLSELRSPHLASMTAQDRLTGGRPFVVFRWIEGRTLDQIIRAEGAQDSARALQVCRAVLLALKVAHDRTIVHRDVTPRNIVIGHGPDTGAIKLVGFAGAPRDAIDARAVPGDPTALAPERFADPRSATPRSDLYAVGVLLYTMLAGRPPFEPEDPTDADAAFERLSWLHTHAQPTRPNTGVPEGTWRLTLSLLEKRAADRPASAEAALAALSAGDHTSVPPPFVPDAPATRDPFEALVKGRSALDAASSSDRMDPFDLSEEATVADASFRPGARQFDGEDEDDEPTMQQNAPSLSVAEMLFASGGERRIDPFARTAAVIDDTADSPASSESSTSSESSMDRLSALVEADPLAIEAEHDSLSDVVDELTLPGQVSHMRAMMMAAQSAETDPPTRPQRPNATVPQETPIPRADASMDELLTRPLHSGAAIPEAPLDDLPRRPRPPASPPGLPSSPARPRRRVGEDVPTRTARPTGKAQRPTPQPRQSDALARLPDVSAFADPGPDEISTIAAARRARPRSAAQPDTPAAAPSPPAANPLAAREPAPTKPAQTATRPLNLPDQNPTQRMVGVAIAIAALLAIISGLMWFTSSSPAPADASPASSAPVRTPIGE